MVHWSVSFSYWVEQITKLLFIIITALITYQFGIRKYLSQREHEQITKRYIDNGIDLAIEGIEHVFAIYRRNFTNALQMLKNFRQKQASNIELEESEYDRKCFAKYDQKFFNISPFQKIISLLGSDGGAYHKIVQNLFAKVDIASNFFELDLSVGIKVFMRGKLNCSSEEFFQKYIQEIKRCHDEIDQYYVLIAELQSLSRLVEIKIMSAKDIEKFKHLPEVKASLQRMNAFYVRECQCKEESMRTGDQASVTH